MDLKGRVAVVTGGGTGIGRAISELFAREGASVVVNYARSREASEETVKCIRSRGGTAVAVAADVTKQPEASRLMEEAVREFGKLDYLINNAGWSKRTPHERFDDLTDEIWNRTLDTNLRGLFYCVRAAAPLLKQQKGAAIVNIASVAALRGEGSSIAYAASKGGVVTMTTPPRGTVWASVRAESPVPGGRSTTR